MNGRSDDWGEMGRGVPRSPWAEGPTPSKKEKYTKMSENTNRGLQKETERDFNKGWTGGLELCVNAVLHSALDAD